MQKKNNHLVKEASGTADGGYWPSQEGLVSLSVSAERAGELTRVTDQNVQATVEGFISREHITENGWPDPMAAAEYFRYAIAQGDPKAHRQLAILLVGVVSGKLELRDVQVQQSRTALSLQSLVSEYQEGGRNDFACVEIVYTQAGKDVVLGFNSPYTLFCPVPISRSDRELAHAWERLARTLTGSKWPEKWEADAMDEWKPVNREIRQIRSWINVEKRQEHRGTSPPWTHVFDSDKKSAPEPYGRGRKLSVYWETERSDRYIKIALPTAEPGDYWPDEEAKCLGWPELLELVPEIRKLQTKRAEFERFELARPNRDHTVWALWREHLIQLLQGGQIAAFGVRPDRRQLAVLAADRLTAAILENVVVLDREQIMIRSCSPMEQDPVPGSSTRKGQPRYPDYPLRSDYFGLVQTDDNRNVVELLERGESFSPDAPDLAIKSRETVATWNLHLKGRSDRLSFTLSVPAALHKAHWMVWPHFRSIERSKWCAYYIYEHCTDARIHLAALWTGPEGSRLHQGEVADRDGMRPVQFAAGTERRHTGGPPIAVTVQNTETGQELGLYVIRLEALSRRDMEVNVGVDFGTPHTVASVEVHGEKSLVKLSPEQGSAVDDLVLHISENWSHVINNDDGLKKRSLWLPTYFPETSQSTEGLLPSELLTIQRLAQLKATDVALWQPGLDCVIPVMNMQRQDLADHLLADFKWNVSLPAFRGSEPKLREIYLGMVTELVMAEVIWRRLEAFPGGKVNFTFTYPLRTSNSQVQDFERMLNRVLKGSSQSLGMQLGLTNSVGMYNESLAAKGGTRRFGEVCLVGDLGGGTLDLFISANKGPGIDFKEVADSARIGGNQLLRVIAQHPDHLLPKQHKGWSGKPGEIETKLRAWIRSYGSQRLFGAEADGEDRHPGLGLSGFEKPADANLARALINRYFRLIAEYMSRSLVAFLARHWYPEVLRTGQALDVLQVIVQLRGNGWRLWHDKGNYQKIERTITQIIELRAKSLWKDGDLWRDARPELSAHTCTPGGSSESDSKRAPIMEAVGKALAHSDVDTYSHALTKLHLIRGRDSAALGKPAVIRWFDQMPFNAGGGTDLQVEFRNVEPPIPLNPPDDTVAKYLDDLEAHLKKEINAELQENAAWNESNFRAPVAALVWEASFKSQRFRNGS